MYVLGLHPQHLIILQTKPPNVCYTEQLKKSIKCIPLDGSSETHNVESDLPGHLSGLCAAPDIVSSVYNSVLFYAKSYAGVTELVRYDVLTKQRRVVYTMNRESVPTSVSISPDGMVY